MSYQTFKSFADVQKALGFKSKEKKNTEPKEEKEIKCRVCGAPMKKVPGTNIIACTGEVKTQEGGTKPCENFIILDHMNK